MQLPVEVPGSPRRTGHRPQWPHPSDQVWTSPAWWSPSDQWTPGGEADTFLMISFIIRTSLNPALEQTDLCIDVQVHVVVPHLQRVLTGCQQITAIFTDRQRHTLMLMHLRNLHVHEYWFWNLILNVLGKSFLFSLSPVWAAVLYVCQSRGSYWRMWLRAGVTVMKVRNKHSEQSPALCSQHPEYSHQPGATVTHTNKHYLAHTVCHHMFVIVNLNYYKSFKISVWNGNKI